ncbi:MAG: PEP-CTERM sorting domain-containing protein [Planctomycetes bacterium]|nr:PEP-CTERM sorting domain-containing protein [Planctomycetota bacterium]
MRRCCLTTMVAVGLLALGSAGYAADLSIYDVQYTTDPGGDSPYNTQIQNVAGGVVTHKWDGFNDRVYLQDPAHPTWGAIAVKDWEGDLLSSVEIGDWVSFQNIYIEEYRATTFLQYDSYVAPDVTFTIESTGNEVPAPTLLTAADLCIPVDHGVSEPYESMVVTLEDVLVGARDLGKAGDNYELMQGSDLAWGADYMNVDAGGPYHPYIYTGAELDSITGIVEQYTRLPDWDYYQLLTRSTADIVPEPASLLLFVGAGLLLRRR